jgi:Holliday junction resolvase RusA-like endonuclease
MTGAPQQNSAVSHARRLAGPEAEVPALASPPVRSITAKKQTFHLPFPPTANLMWRRSGKRIHRSSKYQAWADEAGRALILQRPKKTQGPVRLTIGLRRADSRRYDIDNRVKPLLDLLVSHLIIESDDHACVREITVHVDPTIDPGAQVTLHEVGA